MNQGETNAYGLKVLAGNQKALMKLKKTVRPLEHGHKVWTSSWMLIDYLQTSQSVSRAHVLDIGCGWGMTGIYCAKMAKADVVWADIDAAVYPYLKLMAQTNEVKANFLNLGIEQIGRSQLYKIDIIVGSDICFCDTMINPLRRLINRAKEARVKLFLLSDPGRWPFDDLAELFVNKRGVELIPWESKHPHKMTGKILKIKFNRGD